MKKLTHHYSRKYAHKYDLLNLNRYTLQTALTHG